MKSATRAIMNAAGFTAVAALLLALSACGGGNGPAAGDSSRAPEAAAAAGNSGTGPDTSGLAAMVLGRINQDPMRQEMKVTGKLVEFKVTSVATEVHEGMGASAVVECAGTVVFDGEVLWHFQDMAPRKAGEPAKFECQVEYLNQGSGWQVIGPMGIDPL